jgi:hypothetical protein
MGADIRGDDVEALLSVDLARPAACFSADVKVAPV